ncbi:MAG: fumarylacetoacetate hydrolase family protein [Deltaproteobacteria bacterium]|nr:fumarylacetoacetate hydrolase family protein [Deltaproteobacteria bacterium]
MRLIRFKAEGEPGIKYGSEKNGQIQELTGDIFGQFKVTDRAFSLSQVTLLAPCQPTKVVAVGLNYRDHIEEMHHTVPDEPVIFIKPASSVIGPSQVIICPPRSHRVDYEAELAVVISRHAKNVSPGEASRYILGYTCLNDVTARDLQAKDQQWTRAKGFDTFCPIGPVIETELDPSDLSVEAWLNGEKRQSSRTSNLLFNVPTLVAFISGVMTLEPGDVIATGTPSGVGPVKPGDSIEIRVQGIGSLINKVVAE